MSPPTLTRLSKSRFVTGWQCPKLLWWTVHEPEAEELQPDRVLQDLFDQGIAVGELARDQFPGGVLVDHPYKAYAERLASTQAAIESGAPAVFEACVQAGGVFAAVDVLLRGPAGWTVIEVKSSTKVKDEHIPDVAVQVWALRQAGLVVERAELMHLNTEFRHPDEGTLFVREDVTEEMEAFLPQVPDLVTALTEMLEGDLPEVPIGLHCDEPRECPFKDRCWPDDPQHISRLYNVGPKKTDAYMRRGIHRIEELPAKEKLPQPAQRQVRALREGRLIVEPWLGKALEEFEGPVGYLDFETISRAIPPWNGLGPWRAVTAQFSYHEDRRDGDHAHVGWLAEGPGDPRREAAHRLIDATAGARRIVTYSSYEKSRIRELALAVPDLAEPLEELVGKLVDLLPVVRNHVYHPDFQGSFSLKYVLTPMVPDLTYDDLVIVDGRVASVEIARLLFHAHRIPAEERGRVRQDLLDYCERDTWATVRLLARLRDLAGADR